MSSDLKPITVWGKGGPNPPKAAILLTELKIPFTIIEIPYSDIKKPEYLAINPNGRLPSIRDPNNNDIIIWESGAIIEYLIETYDKDHRISFPRGTPEYFHAKQWLFFQTTGQGPYYGQAAFFKKFHPEKLPSAIERFAKEVNRVTGVLETWLAGQKEKYGGEGDGPWLVENKFSYADLAFVTWQKMVTLFLTKEEYAEGSYPVMQEWIGKIHERHSVKQIRGTAAPGMEW